MLVAEVAIPVPLSRAFSYEVTPEVAAELVPGSRVLCDFRKRQVVGVVVRISEQEPSTEFTIKPLAGVIDKAPVLPAELFGFLLELSRYYYAPVGEVLRMALPALERGEVERLEAQGSLDLGVEISRTRTLTEAKEQWAVATSEIETPGSLRGQAKDILALLRAAGPSAISRLEQQHKSARAAVKKLVGLGLARIEERDRQHAPLFDEAPARDQAPELTAGQAEAVAHIDASMRGEVTPRGVLLFGVTGSGKTEVYLHAIESCLSRGKGALVMVPEIALTPQLVDRFRARFGDELAVVHSALAEKARHAMYKRLLSGEVRVAIGARSALFAPVPDLGLVIVDEEHDSSFKQEEGVRYQARDMAILRAHRAAATVVLGSATPSLESVALANRGALAEIRLPDRARRQASLPKVEIIDLKRFRAGPSGDPLLSLPLHRALQEVLGRKEQAIIFLNRRGHSPTVVCFSCGTLATCKACSVSLTFHQRRRGADVDPRHGRVVCHYCGYEASMPAHCESCNSPELALEGLGTEKLEETLATSFPEARIGRLDRDVASGGKAARVLARMRKGEIDILVGTQMVTKGHDYPNVTLVGVVNADAALGLPDFRASERAFQLMVQVAGRAGRHDLPGKVLIQTRNPEHPALVRAASHDVLGFLESELEDRRMVKYPPFARIALLRIDGVDPKVTEQEAARLARRLADSRAVQAGKVELLGPAPAPLARLRGRYRYRIMVRADERSDLRSTLNLANALIPEMDRRLRIVIDVDPVSMM